MVPSTSPSVLLVEDSEDDLFFFRQLLKKAGVELPFAAATDGQQAIAELMRRVQALPAEADPAGLIVPDSLQP